MLIQSRERIVDSCRRQIHPGFAAVTDHISLPISPEIEADMSLSREYASFVAGLRYEDLPPEVVDRAKGVTLQALTSAPRSSIPR